MSNPVERPQVVLVSRCAIQDEENNLLLIRRVLGAGYNGGLFEFPGGKVDVGQVVEDARAREIYEETGLVVEKTSPSVFVDSRIIPDGPYEGMLYALLCCAGRVKSGELSLSDEHDKSAWFPYSAVLADGVTAETKKSVQTLAALSFLKTN